MPLAPRSTLFPYTTLFRSRLLWLGALTSSIGTWMQKVAQAWLIVTLSGSSSAFYLGLEDRKSTRLNSSHSQTSYAVFCLKIKMELSTNESSGRVNVRSGRG